ncbi:probable tRNA pseudouridine synthase 1 isoform X2 [Daphnia pulicaria]|nr:probable tRNA pseudouridine synthase 1 isoform X2 [Daphnia pulicaria]
MQLKRDANSNAPIKMGHGGTLDKNATGILVVGINEGCAQLPAFLDGSKVYFGNCVFGRATDTYNNEGQTTMEKPYDHITLTEINDFKAAIKGEVLQKPPPYSALKLQGRRLSDLAREGVPVDPKPRLVTCYDFTVIEFAPPKLTFELSCSKGFYVRSLVHDLGIVLNSCAYLDTLERTRQGPFETQHCLTEEQCTVTGIRKKILEMQQVTREYLDIQMEKYRLRNSLQSQNQKFVNRKYFESSIHNKKYDQWDYAK